MGIRETLNENSRLTITVVGVAAMLATAFVVMQVFAGRRTIPDTLPNTYFTSDDGKTFFADAGENIPPFDHDGKQAAKAYVYQCCGKKFVGYLERYNTEAHKLKVAGKGSRETELRGMEIKKPGDSAWVKSHDLVAASKIADVRCPHGNNATPEAVEP